MQYIIETHDVMEELMRLFIAVDNQSNNIEFYLERIRLSINNYTEYPDIISMLADLNLETTKDPDLALKLMNRWNIIVLRIYYYLLHVDMQLPITEIHLQHRDLRLVTEG